MLNIVNWQGRLGNNILQLIRAIHLSKILKHNTIKFPIHNMLSSTMIKIGQNNNLAVLNDSFFNLKKYRIDDPEPHIMKLYFQQYIKPIFNVEFDGKIYNDNELFIHFRGGDIFSSNPHKSYIQPPLSFYNNIIVEYDKIKLICEDKKNPCIAELLKKNNVEYNSNNLKNDLSILLNASNLVIGFGTFGFLLYLMNSKLKKLYIPDYVINELPKGNWGNIELHIIKLPNYIKVGEWKNSIEQRNIMLCYG